MADLQQLEDSIVALSLLDAAELVKKLESRLGVSAAAAAPVMVAGGGGAAGQCQEPGGGAELAVPIGMPGGGGGGALHWVQVPSVLHLPPEHSPSPRPRPQKPALLVIMSGSTLGSAGTHP